MLKISNFLNKSNEGNYVQKVKGLKELLGEIPNSSFFLKYIHSNFKRAKIHSWQRTDPISNTPPNHTIHASYYRIVSKTCFRIRDKDRGRPRPDIFVPEHNIMVENIANRIEGLHKLYTVIKPFGYDFPDILEVDGMTFHLYELFNPLYLCDRNGNGPEPLIINGIKKAPVSNKIYTELYKIYIKEKREMVQLIKQ